MATLDARKNLSYILKDTDLLPMAAQLPDSNDIAITFNQVIALFQGKGAVNVFGASGTISSFKCVADGTPVDDAVIDSIITAALADLPAKVNWGAGIYGVNQGNEQSVANAAGMLEFVCAGKDQTTFLFSGVVELASLGFKYFSFKTASTPTVGDYANYWDGFSISGCTFKDADPYVHQAHTAQSTGTSTSTADAGVLEDSGQAWTINEHIGKQIRNVGDKAVGYITANTATTITAVMYAGTTDLWTLAGGDSYEISLISTIEESHAIYVEYANLFQYTDVGLDSIGDEGFDTAHVTNIVADKVYAINTPSIGWSGGAISMLNGTKSATLTNLHIHSGKKPYVRSKVYDSLGIDIVTLGAPTALDTIDSISIKGVIEGAALTTIQLNTAATGGDIDNVSIVGAILLNSQNGVLRRGNLAAVNNLVIGQNIISGMTDACINFDTTATFTPSPLIAFNTMSGSIKGVDGQTVNGNYSGNNFKDITEECYLFFSGTDNVIVGGTAENCGGGTKNCIRSNTNNLRNKVANFEVTNYLGTGGVIVNMEEVKDCGIEQNNPSVSSIAGVQRAISNKTNGGIRTIAGSGRQINHNQLGWLLDAGSDAIELPSGFVNSQVKDNIINIAAGVGAGFRFCIDILAGADNNDISGNIVDGSTAQPFIRDNGTGNIIKDNVGFLTEAQGTGDIVSTTTSDVITHGLAYTPTLGEISITLGNNPTVSVGSVWVDTIGATTFTVNCEVDPSTSGLSFGWAVRKI